MKKGLIIFGFVVIILIFLSKNTNMDETVLDLVQQVSTNLPLGAQQLDCVGHAISSLVRAGATTPVLSYMLAQIALETGHFKSVPSLQDNNLSGIKYFGQTGATQGVPAPNKNGDNGYYAHYNSYDDWANDYMRILSSVGTANPLEATNAYDFAAALKQNRYFQSDLNTYANNIASLSNSYQPFLDILQPILKFA